MFNGNNGEMAIEWATKAFRSHHQTPGHIPYKQIALGHVHTQDNAYTGRLVIHAAAVSPTDCKHYSPPAKKKGGGIKKEKQVEKRARCCHHNIRCRWSTQSVGRIYVLEASARVPPHLSASSLHWGIKPSDLGVISYVADLLEGRGPGLSIGHACE
ncbi:hypothetical protein AG1IA_08604 [Rhizoctonia solani AG-1 IA]|uniref:Uncharacterized protein n=1 Tax=Thanatephorus cucumeris (strain AG1-IA) TaxID=983506 RepID=L8WKV6_THACA|nr:hypothetical protein AG1IA_08604 [Rhizoctonia solani AG-1 IA]